MTNLTPRKEDIKTRGLILVLKDYHDELDAAVSRAYGWPRDLSEQEILERLVVLNEERAEAVASKEKRAELRGRSNLKRSTGSFCGPMVRRFSLFGPEPLQLGLVDAQAEEDREAEAHHARHLRQRQKIEGWNVLGGEKGENQCEDGNDFGQADEHNGAFKPFGCHAQVDAIPARRS
ncbi:MAG: hypothetical protein ACYC0C_00605 [Devosia sp.]